MPVKSRTPPISGTGRCLSSASPKSRVEPIRRAATTPVNRMSTPNIRLRMDVGTTWQPGGPPPSPETNAANPTSRNSRFQSRSRLAASSSPPMYMTMHRNVTSSSVSMLGTCPATDPQSTRRDVPDRKRARDGRRKCSRTGIRPPWLRHPRCPAPRVPHGTTRQWRGETERQQQEAVPELCPKVEPDAVDDADTPIGCDGRIEQDGQRLLIEPDPHQGQGHEACRASCAGDEAGRDRVGDEPDQVGQPETSDQQHDEAGRERTQHDDRDHRCEQRVAFQCQCAPDHGQHDQRRHRRRGDRTEKTARQRDHQAASEAAEQYEADPLGGIGCQGTREDDCCEGDLADHDGQSGNAADRKCEQRPLREYALPEVGCQRPGRIPFRPVQRLPRLTSAKRRERAFAQCWRERL